MVGLFANTGIVTAAETKSLLVRKKPHCRNQLLRCRTVGLFANNFIATAAEIPSSLTRRRPHRRHQFPQCRTVGLVANPCIVNCRQPTEQRLTVYIIAGGSALGLIIGTSAFSLITSYTGPFLRRLLSSQPSWWGNVLIPGSFPFDLSPVSSGPLAHYK